MTQLAPKFYAVCLALVALTGTARCQMLGERGIPIIDAYMVEAVTPPRTASPLNDYLVALATATDTNIIADATDFPPDAIVQPYPAAPIAIDAIKNGNKKDWEPTRLNVIADVADHKALSWLRYDRSTFLFWSEPDPLALAPKLIAAKNTELVQLPAPLLANADVGDLLNDYFSKVHRWDGRMPDKTIKVNVHDLPTDIRNLVLREARKELERQSGIFSHYSIFDEDFWNTARVNVHYFPALPGRGVPLAATGPPPVPTLNPYLIVAKPKVLEEDFQTEIFTREILQIGRLDPLVPPKKLQSSVPARRRN